MKLPRLKFRDNFPMEGKQAFSIGVAIGYWPCLEGPFIQFRLGFWKLDLWFGYPSYKAK